VAAVSWPLVCGWSRRGWPGCSASSWKMSGQILRLIVEERNALRQASHLPLLDVEREVERLRQVEEDKAFEEYIAANRALEDRLVRRIVSRWQRHCGDPNWKPGFVVGLGIGATIRGLFLRRWQGE
jgi:hypothetical protein